MFNKASKSELKTWMFGDLVLFIILILASVSMFGSFADDTDKIGYLIFGLLFIALGFLCMFFFYKMIKAFQTYEERMEELEKIMEEERLQQEQEEKERIQREEEETKKFIEEYQKKVQEAEEQRKLEKEQKGNK